MDRTNLQKKQFDLRAKLLSLYYDANAGHIGCSLSCMDLLIALFRGLLACYFDFAGI